MGQANRSTARKNFCENLRNLRKISGKRIATISRETGISYTYLRELEKDDFCKNPSMETIDRLAEYYDIKPYMFFL